MITTIALKLSVGQLENAAFVRVRVEVSSRPVRENGEVFFFFRNGYRNKIRKGQIKINLIV